MRTIETTLYKFDELSEDAKQKAIEHYRTRIDEIPWQSEIFDSLKQLFESANIKLRDYSLGLDSYSYVKFEMDESVYNLTGARALGWLENNVFFQFRLSRAEYMKSRKKLFSYGYRIGKMKECPLTGTCFDHDFIETLIESVKSGDSLGEAFKLRLPEKYVELLQAEYDAERSDENIIERLSDDEFTEDGKRL